MPDIKQISNDASIKEEASKLITAQNYIMFYRHGMVPYAFKGFSVKGDLKKARERANKHCAIMGYRLIWVSPMLADLDEEEKNVISNRGGNVQMPDYSNA